MPLPEGGGPSRLSSKKELPCCFLLSMTCRDGSACAPGTVSASARRKSLPDRLDAVRGHRRGARQSPYGECAPLVCQRRSQAGRVPVAGGGRFGTAFRGCRRVRRKPPRASRKAELGGLFSAISLSGRSCRFSSGWPRRVAASVPFILKGVAALCRGRLSVDVLDAAAIGISLVAP